VIIKQAVRAQVALLRHVCIIGDHPPSGLDPYIPTGFSVHPYGLSRPKAEPPSRGYGTPLARWLANYRRT